MAVAAWLAPLPVSADLAPGTGSFVFVDKANHPDKPITVWYHRPEEAANDAPVVFVMHGVKRNGVAVKVRRRLLMPIGRSAYLVFGPLQIDTLKIDPMEIDTIQASAIEVNAAMVIAVQCCAVGYDPGGCRRGHR